jgi:hypothetical protein
MGAASAGKRKWRGRVWTAMGIVAARPGAIGETATILIRGIRYVR